MLRVTPKALAVLAGRADPKAGARGLRQVVAREVERPIARRIVAGAVPGRVGDHRGRERDGG